MNRVTFLGNLTRDVEIRYVGEDKKPLAKFAIAVNEYRADKNGDAREAMFIDVTVFGRAAETAHQYLAKGRKVLISGKLTLERWTSQEDKKPRSKHVVIADEVHFLDSPKASGEDGHEDEGE